MIEIVGPSGAQITLASTRREVIEALVRERRVTPRRATVAGALRWWIVFTLAACGGGSHKADTYAKGNEVQQACCEHLAGGARESCLRGIVRVDNQDAARDPVNQATYDCVVSHFTCDGTTGRPTPESAQAQLECIQDLPPVTAGR